VCIGCRPIQIMFAIGQRVRSGLEEHGAGLALAGGRALGLAGGLGTHRERLDDWECPARRRREDDGSWSVFDETPGIAAGQCGRAGVC